MSDLSAPTPANGELTVRQDGPVRRITLALPERRNALSRTLVAALGAAFAKVEAGGETRVVVLAGDGPPLGRRHDRPAANPTGRRPGPGDDPQRADP